MHRSILRWFLILAGAAGVIGLIAVFAPTHVGRYLIADRLDALAIGHEGVETLEVNLFAGQARLGPVRFRGDEGAHGRLGAFDLTLEWHPLLDRRLGIRRLSLTGIDVIVVRHPERGLSINEVELAEWLEAPSADAPKPTSAPVWGAGADELELVDSKLFFEDVHGGVVEVDVQRLALLGFRTWEPDRPGRVELLATVNGIRLTGPARRGHSPIASSLLFARASNRRTCRSWIGLPVRRDSAGRRAPKMPT